MSSIGNQHTSKEQDSAIKCASEAMWNADVLIEQTHVKLCIIV